MIIKGDCHEILKKIESNKYDLLYTDPPFCMTGAKWDKELKWEELWEDIWRVLKPNGAVILHSTQRFSMYLASTQLKNFKYKYIWKKNINTNFFLVKKQPLRVCEDVLVFYKKQPTYNPQMKGDKFVAKRNVKVGGKQAYYGEKLVNKKNEYIEAEGHKGKYPNDLLEYPIRKGEGGASTRPDELVDFFIKTYTNEGDKVLDITCYDGLTGKRCDILKREYTGIDLDPV